MTAIRIRYASENHAQADQLLAQIGEAMLELDRLTAKLAGDLRAFRASQDAKIEWQKGKVDYLGQQLKELMKEHRADFFAITGMKSCSLDLPHGALLYAKEDYVVKPRKVDVLANLKAQGLQEGIRVVESVDWDVLATWPDDKLALAGTERKTKETFAYEVKEAL